MRNGSLYRGDVVATLSDANWQIQGIGDFYGDGHADVLWRNPVTGYVAIWQIESRVITSQTFAIARAVWVQRRAGSSFSRLFEASASA